MPGDADVIARLAADNERLTRERDEERARRHYARLGAAREIEALEDARDTAAARVKVLEEAGRAVVAAVAEFQGEEWHDHDLQHALESRLAVLTAALSPSPTTTTTGSTTDLLGSCPECKAPYGDPLEAAAAELGRAPEGWTARGRCWKPSNGGHCASSPTTRAEAVVDERLTGALAALNQATRKQAAAETENARLSSELAEARADVEAVLVGQPRWCQRCGRATSMVPAGIRNEGRLAGRLWWCSACGYPPMSPAPAPSTPIDGTADGRALWERMPCMRHSMVGCMACRFGTGPLAAPAIAQHLEHRPAAPSSTEAARPPHTCDNPLSVFRCAACAAAEPTPKEGGG